jgi:hypothetical protein
MMDRPLFTLPEDKLLCLQQEALVGYLTVSTEVARRALTEASMRGDDALTELRQTIFDRTRDSLIAAEATFTALTDAPTLQGETS